MDSEAQARLSGFWPKVAEDVRSLSQNDMRQQELPLARIKRIMKLDEEVKMISSEAPALFSKAAQIFITELTLRAWIHTEDSKRRTLQRNDIAMAITKFDQFDFLIDIVPREEIHKTGNQEQVPQTGQAQVVNQAAPVSNNGQSQAIQLTSSGSNGSNGQVQYYVTLSADQLQNAGGQQIVVQQSQ